MATKLVKTLKIHYLMLQLLLFHVIMQDLHNSYITKIHLLQSK